MPRDLSDQLSSNDNSLAAEETRSDEGTASITAGSSQAALNSKLDPILEKLHPYTQQLTVADVESCAILEELTFPPQERCTREKFTYRFTVCPELTLGVFTTVDGESDLLTAHAAQPVESSDAQRKAVLLGHIVSTMSISPTVTDNDMAYPTPGNPDPALGHKEMGRTVCLHSLAVLPSVQKLKLGSLLMQAYIARLESLAVADRLALIAHDHLIGYYERFGFKSLGPSQAQFGGGGWYDMVRPLHAQQAKTS